MMYYIVSYLTYSKAIYEMHGGQEMQMILSWGTGVVAIFAAIFLFYMNSFLMRRRKTEFGLYNILGMGKWNIARILCWQNGMLFGTSMVGGLGLGILLSKLSELMAAKMLGNSSPMGFRIEPNAVRNTILLTAVSYGIILLYSLGATYHVSLPAMPHAVSDEAERFESGFHLCAVHNGSGDDFQHALFVSGFGRQLVSAIPKGYFRHSLFRF